MKKVASILVLAFAFIVTAQAQKKDKDNKQGPKFTVEQRVELAVKKMTLKLDLTEKQQAQIKPIMTAQASAKKAAMESRKEHREAGKKPTADEIYEMKSKQLDSMIAFKNKMKNILTKEQFDAFEKMVKNRKGKKQKGEGKKGKGKKGEGKREQNNENR